MNPPIEWDRNPTTTGVRTQNKPETERSLMKRYIKKLDPSTDERPIGLLLSVITNKFETIKILHRVEYVQFKKV